MVAMNRRPGTRTSPRSSPAAICSTTPPSRCRRPSSARTSTSSRALTAICNREYSDPRQRQLFKNIIYVGALSALLDMDVTEIEKLFGEQFKGKEKLIAPNIHALHLGRDWVLQTSNARSASGSSAATRWETESSSRVIRAALGAVYGGATVCAPGIRSRVVLARRCLHASLQPAARRSRDQAEQVRDRPSRGRACLDRRRHRRG